MASSGDSDSAAAPAPRQEGAAVEEDVFGRGLALGDFPATAADDVHGRPSVGFPEKYAAHAITRKSQMRDGGVKRLNDRRVQPLLNPGISAATAGAPASEPAAARRPGGLRMTPMSCSFAIGLAKR